MTRLTRSKRIVPLVAVFVLLALALLLFRQVAVSRSSNSSQRAGQDVYPNVAAVSAEPIGNTVAPETLSIPTIFQFSSNAFVVPVANSDELLDLYSSEQQEQIRAYYKGYGEGPFNLSEYAVKDIFSFRTVEQLNWLLSNGFPTPDDVLAAQAMTDAELAELADTGNLKAMSFYLDRLAAESPLVPSSNASPADLKEMLRRGELENRVLAIGSPFSAYTIGRQAIAGGQNGMALAAFFYADRLGDTRGSDFAVQWNGLHNVDAREAVTSFIALQSRAGLQNPQLNDPRYIGRRPRFPKWD